MIEELIIFIKIKEGDVKAYESLFYKYYTPLCKYVTLLIGSYDDAEEIVQELAGQVVSGIVVVAPTMVNWLDSKV